MSNTVCFTASCGCKYDVEANYNWVDEVVVIEDITPVFICQKHNGTICPKCNGWLRGGECENCSLP